PRAGAPPRLGRGRRARAGALDDIRRAGNRRLNAVVRTTLQGRPPVECDRRGITKARGVRPPGTSPKGITMSNAVIVDAVRTPIGRAVKGSLKDVRADDLAAIPLRALLERNPQLDPTTIDDVM